MDEDNLFAISNITCKVRQNSSIPIPGIDFYEGIPLTVVLNILGWILLLICFTILRKIAWDYGRLALFIRKDNPMRNNLLDEENSSESMIDRGRSVPRLKWSDNCLWICTLFRLNNTEIVRKCGRDAYIYLLFQCYLIVYICLVSLLSFVVILPVNLSGNIFSLNRDFGSLTIANSRTEYLWIHSVMAFIYPLLAVAFMQRFTYCVESLQKKMEADGEDGDHQQAQNTSNTLMISNIGMPNEEAVTEYLTGKYSKESIADIQFTYDVAALTKLDAQRRWATRARQNSEQLRQLNNQNDYEAPTLYPYACSWYCRCCFCDECGCHKVDAVEFYTDLEDKLQAAVQVEMARTRRKPLGIVFLTMRDSDMADRVYEDFALKCCWNNRNSDNVGAVTSDQDPVVSKKVISTQSWRVEFAPPVDAIIWENLSISGYQWWLRTILINTFILIICFFFTTPVILLEKMERLLHRVISSVLDKFLPTLLLWLFACLLPNVVYFVDPFIGHWTRYSQHHAVMTKTFAFLILMVIIIPSLGLTSVQSVFENKIVERYQCIFASDNVAFFINYVVTSAFLGTGLELLRLPELFFYAISVLLTRSSAERSALRESKVYDFHFGFQYAWFLCISTVILTYSIPCPLIAPCGLIYLIFKHIVDRYNIYFAYRPLHINIGLHTSAGNIFAASAILIPGCVFAFIWLRYGEMQTAMMESMFYFALSSLIITAIVVADHIKFGQLKRLAVIFFDKYWSCSFTERLETKDEEKHVLYVASVLQGSKNDPSEGVAVSSAPKTYGTITNC